MKRFILLTLLTLAPSLSFALMPAMRDMSPGMSMAKMKIMRGIKQTHRGIGDAYHALDQITQGLRRTKKGLMLAGVIKGMQAMQEDMDKSGDDSDMSDMQ